MLHYKTFERENHTEWVVFVHGAGGSSSIWYKQVKPFREHFNLLLIDLRGHGKSKGHEKEVGDFQYTFNEVSEDVLEVLDHLGIEAAHFMGVSLGTILIRNIAEIAPQRVKTMILGGAVTRLTLRSQTLATLGNWFKGLVPYMWIYKLAALIIMPKKSQSQSRLLFIREAKKLYQKEFIRWYRLTCDVNPLLKLFEEKEVNIPSLYLMGEQDYMFLAPVEHLIKTHKSSKLVIVPDSGHVSNVDNAEFFNKEAIRFIKQHVKNN